MASDIVFLGDDFTGASDSLATYAKSGWRTRLVLNTNQEASTGDLDALGLPTDLRSLSPEKARDEIARLWPLIEAADPKALHLKVCSTFDSSPQTGSIGAAVNELTARFKPDVVAVIGGQPSLGRYCVFGNLFARGPDGGIHRIDRHPVMSRHPVTPMAEADLRLHLAAQGLKHLKLVALPDIDDPAILDSALQNGPVLLDVSTTRDQQKITQSLLRSGSRHLLIGASSVAEILAEQDRKSRTPRRSAPPVSPKILFFAGSRSVIAQSQIEAARTCQKVLISPNALRGGTAVKNVVSLLNSNKPVIAHLDPVLDYGLSPDALAGASSAFISKVLKQVNVGYLGLAGGDTSSRISMALGFDSLEFEQSLGAGVCICTAIHPDPKRDRMRVMLKGGQMGTPDLFDQFVAWAKSTALV